MNRHREAKQRGTGGTDNKCTAMACENPVEEERAQIKAESEIA